jgi:RimJ/RimL family protein N-acetyltransferase
MNIRPVTLEGRHVRLEPLTMAHHPALSEIGLDEDLWRWTTTRISTPAEMRAYIETALEEQSRATALPFATILKSSGRAVGSTRFGNMDGANRRLEIGWTWVGREWQRTPVNTEAKYLMLGHAFETLDAIRVEFKTDVLNERSRRAILRIGATEEGTLRNHMITSTGRFRHSVYFSIIDSEWPSVKRGLESKLGRSWTSHP